MGHRTDSKISERSCQPAVASAWLRMGVPVKPTITVLRAVERRFPFRGRDCLNHGSLSLLRSQNAKSRQLLGILCLQAHKVVHLFCEWEKSCTAVCGTGWPRPLSQPVHRDPTQRLHAGQQALLEYALPAACVRSKATLSRALTGQPSSDCRTLWTSQLLMEKTERTHSRLKN